MARVSIHCTRSERTSLYIARNALARVTLRDTRVEKE